MLYIELNAIVMFTVITDLQYKLFNGKLGTVKRIRAFAQSNVSKICIKLHNFKTGFRYD